MTRSIARVRVPGALRLPSDARFVAGLTCGLLLAWALAPAQGRAQSESLAAQVRGLEARFAEIERSLEAHEGQVAQFESRVLGVAALESQVGWRLRLLGAR